MVPRPPHEWVEKVRWYHKVGEGDCAAKHGIPVEQYRNEALRSVRAMVVGKRARLRIKVGALARFLETSSYETFFHGHPSSGANDFELRAGTEATVLGVAHNTLPDDRPAYGYLVGSDETHKELAAYGAVVLYLLPSVDASTTVVFGDAMGSTGCGEHHAFAPDPVTNPSLLCSFSDSDLNGATRLRDVVDPAYGYAELQIYGRLNPRDVEFVAFCGGRAPSSDMVRALRSFAIPHRSYDSFDQLPGAAPNA